MNNKLYLTIAFHLILFLESMVLVTAIEGYSSDLFRAAFSFNTLYFPIGGLLNYGAYRLLQSVLSTNFKLLLSLHFLAIILILNIITHFSMGEWITANLFTNTNNTRWFAILTHLLVVDCYILAILLTRKIMRNE